MGLSRDAVHFIYTQWGFESGKEIFRKIIQQGDITGVYCYTDNCAAGMVYEAAVMGIKIPERLSIVGSNDLPIASQVFPQITTVSQPKEQQGAEAAKMLLDMIENKNTGSDKMLRPELIIRNSTLAI
jgi:DNA-binding LacI/PurR family transcriptional regulator